MKNILLIIACTFLAKWGTAQQTYTPEEAAKHVGDSIKVCGKIFGGRFFETSNNAPTLLNMGAAFPNSPITIMIPGSVRLQMGIAPEVQWREKNVCVIGTVILFKNKPEIIVYNTTQIEVKE